MVSVNIKSGANIFGVVGKSTVVDTADANAVAGDVLAGRVAYEQGNRVVGTVPNYWGVVTRINNKRINNNRFEVAVEHGYHGCNWMENCYEYMELNEVAETIGLTPQKLAARNTVCGVTGSYTSDANSAASNILSGKTAYVNGNKLTGTIPSKGAATITPGTSNQTINAGQYLSGAQTITGDVDLVAANIKSGINIFGVTGNYKGNAQVYDLSFFFNANRPYYDIYILHNIGDILYSFSYFTIAGYTRDMLNQSIQSNIFANFTIGSTKQIENTHVVIYYDGMQDANAIRMRPNIETIDGRFFITFYKNLDYSDNVSESLSLSF